MSGEKRRKDVVDPMPSPTDDGRGLYLTVFSHAEKELAKIGPPAIHRARKAGIARFGDRFVDVVSEGSLIEMGSRVQVVEIEGNRIVVKEI